MLLFQLFLAFSGVFLTESNNLSIKNCFISHKNIRISSCGPPITTKSPLSLEECQNLCVNLQGKCQNIQYYYYRNFCEIFDIPSPLEVNQTAVSPEKIRKRETGATRVENEKKDCSTASLSPAIGTSYLIPRWDCLTELQLEGIQKNEDTAVQNTVRSEGIRNRQIEDVAQNLAVEILPVIPDCPSGEYSRIQIIDGVEIDRAATVKFAVPTPELCFQACRISTYPDGSRLPLLCRSAHFDRIGRHCSVYSDALNPNGYLDYKPNQNAIYAEKICIPDSSLPTSCDNVFRRIPQHILLGQASEIISVTSEQECVLKCIESTIIKCQSILHYPDFPLLNCILNVHTRNTKNYVEVGTCTKRQLVSSRVIIPPNPFEKSVALQPQQVQVQQNSITSNDITSLTTEWSEWTKCSQDSSSRSRERFCNGCKEIIQVMPCFSNNNFDKALQEFVKEQQVKESETSIRAVPAQSALPVSSETTPTPVIKFLNQNDEKKKSVEFFGPPQTYK
ncbi:unnamed protein product [Caenorhabditis angaria]|uniref:Apple domain-containing protein n=1 Tax=Caenorhabditis angaria TaxID=860376 RepID=A0A9P1J3A2_9PELO|nr:unnamed protein product [Caenorhabditis angaria]